MFDRVPNSDPDLLPTDKSFEVRQFKKKTKAFKRLYDSLPHGVAGSF